MQAQVGLVADRFGKFLEVIATFQGATWVFFPSEV
jgi:hypothetical protein